MFEFIFAPLSFYRLHMAFCQTCFEQSPSIKRSLTTQQSWLLLFAFSPPLFFPFSCLIFFSCWAFSRLHRGGKVFRKAFGILGYSDKVKGKVGGQWNKIFMAIFGSMLQGFCPFSPVSLTELCSFWYGLKDLFILHKLAVKVQFLTIKTDDITGGRKHKEK